MARPPEAGFPWLIRLLEGAYGPAVRRFCHRGVFRDSEDANDQVARHLAVEAIRATQGEDSSREATLARLIQYVESTETDMRRVLDSLRVEEKKLNDNVVTLNDYRQSSDKKPTKKK